MQKIALIPMSAKPYHAGHDGLVRIAAKENDKVFLFVSLSDRGIIRGKTMEKIWKDAIVPSLPNNVIVIYPGDKLDLNGSNDKQFLSENITIDYGNSPVGNVLKYLGGQESEDNMNRFFIYSDPVDAETNFPEKLLLKYAPTLYSEKRVQTRPVPRTSTINISGTEMRKIISSGDKEEFLKFIPSRIDGDLYWKLLTSEMTSENNTEIVENLLRHYVRRYIN